jgi:hypothetical protein
VTVAANFAQKVPNWGTLTHCRRSGWGMILEWR